MKSKIIFEYDFKGSKTWIPDLVQCGAHTAKSCQACVVGNYDSGDCYGDCEYDSGKIYVKNSKQNWIENLVIKFV